MTNEEYIVDLKVKTAGIGSATKKIKELEEALEKVDKASIEYLKLMIELARIEAASAKSKNKLGFSIKDLKDKFLDFGGGVLPKVGAQLGLGAKAIGAIGIAAGATVAAVGALATGLVAVGVVAVDLNTQFKTLEKQLKSTGAQGETLKQLANEAKFLQDSFDIDGGEFAAGINSLVQNFGLTTQEAAAAIKEAAIAGGNSTGQLTELIQEYSTQAAAGGKNAKEFFDSIVNGARLGSFQQDKLLDVSKELTLRYKENTKAVRDALKPLGDEFNNKLRRDFESGAKNIDEVLLTVIERTRELNLGQEETQAIIANLGGGPLEDLGSLDAAYKLIKDSVDAVNKSTNQLSLQEREANERTERKIALQRELADTLGSEVQRIQNALTDAVFQVLESIDTSGEGLKGLADDVIGFIQESKEAFTNVIILFKNFEGALDTLGTVSRTVFASVTLGLSEIIRLIPDAIKGYNDLTGATKEFNDERDREATEKGLNSTISKLNELTDKYKNSSEVIKAATTSIIKDIVKRTNAAAKSGGVLTEEETKQIDRLLKFRIGIINQTESRIEKINANFAGKITDAQKIELATRLAEYERTATKLATQSGIVAKADIEANENALSEYIETLKTKEKTTKTTNKSIEDNTKKTVEAEIEAFNKLKKSFENNFELQRLEAQKQFASGLINENELREKIFAINQQENTVLITITANKKEIAKTGEEALEISKLELKTVKEIKEELDAQLEIKKRSVEIDKTVREGSDELSKKEEDLETKRKIREVTRDKSIKNEDRRQKKIAKIRVDAAKKEVDRVKQELNDKQAAANEAQKIVDDLAANDNLENSKEGVQAVKNLVKANSDLLDVKGKLIDAEEELEEQEDKVKQKRLDEIASRTQRIAGYIQDVTDGLNTALQADISRTESALNAQETRIDAGVELAKMGNDELLNQELERQDKLLQEREKQANKEKAIAAIQTAANLAVAITKAAAEGGGFGSIATIAAVLGAVGVGFASISGLIGGAFADGVIDFKGKGTERSDSNIVAISRGESVITAKGTKNASKMLTMINEGKLKDSDYLTAGLDLAPIQAVNQAIDIRNELNQQIALSGQLLEEMRNFEYKIKFDARGVSETVNTKNKRITKINRN